MTKDLMILGLGVWVILVPFLGFPNSWDTFIFVISGILIIVLVLLLRRDFVNHITSMKRSSSDRKSKTFVENVGQSTPVPTPPVENKVAVKHESDNDNGKDKEENS